MKAKEIVLLILIIAAGVLFYHISTGKMDIYWDWEDDVVLFGKEYSFEDTLTLDNIPESDLQVRNVKGRVEIEGADINDIQVTVKKHIVRSNRAEAARIAEETPILTNRSNGHLIFSMDRNSAGRRKIQADWKIRVPLGKEVIVRNAYGLVRLSSVGKAEVKNHHGGIFIEDIRGVLNIDSSHGNIDVRSAAGNCAIDSRHGDINLENVLGSVNIRHRYGKIHLKEIKQAVTLEGSHSEVLAESVIGPLHLKTTFRKITLFEVGPTMISSHNSNISAINVTGNLNVINSYGHLKAEGIMGNLLIQGRYLDISANNINAENIQIDTSFRKIDLNQYREINHFLIELNDEVGEFENLLRFRQENEFVRYVTKYKKDMANLISLFHIKINGCISDKIRHL